MTKLLQQAIREAKKLPEAEQNALASIILQELADEKRWDEAVASSQHQLEDLAKKVKQGDLVVLERDEL